MKLTELVEALCESGLELEGDGPINPDVSAFCWIEGRPFMCPVARVDTVDGRVVVVCEEGVNTATRNSG